MEPIVRFDSVHIGVADLGDAERAFGLLLGVAPQPTADGATRFQLNRGAVVLAVGAAGLQAISFVLTEGARPDWPAGADAFNGIDVRLHPSSPDPQSAPAAPPSAVQAIDHVVVHTSNLDRAIALWRDRLGLRLALDREFPGRGLRMGFFRSGGVTLEFVSTLPAPADSGTPDQFYGIAYRVADLTACQHRLRHAGADVSEIRPGQKRGTSVATVRSGTLGVPTLLIQDPTRASE